MLWVLPSRRLKSNLVRFPHMNYKAFTLQNLGGGGHSRIRTPPVCSMWATAFKTPLWRLNSSRWHLMYLSLCGELWYREKLECPQSMSRCYLTVTISTNRWMWVREHPYPWFVKPSNIFCRSQQATWAQWFSRVETSFQHLLDWRPDSCSCLVTHHHDQEQAPVKSCCTPLYTSYQSSKFSCLDS